MEKKEFMGVLLEWLAQLQTQSLRHKESLSAYTCELGYTEKECVQLIVDSERQHKSAKAFIIETLNDTEFNPAFNYAFLLADKKMFSAQVHLMFDILYLSYLTAQRPLLKLKNAANSVLDLYVDEYVPRLTQILVAKQVLDETSSQPENEPEQ